MGDSQYIKHDDGTTIKVEHVETFAGDVYRYTATYKDQIRGDIVGPLPGGRYEIRPVRGADINGYSVAESARVLARLHDVGWI